MAVQFASYQGYIKVDYSGIQKVAEKALDVNGDGVVDEKDAEAALDKIYKVASFNMPGGGGFAAGFLLGLR